MDPHVLFLTRLSSGQRPIYSGQAVKKCAIACEAYLAVDIEERLIRVGRDGRFTLQFTDEDVAVRKAAIEEERREAGVPVAGADSAARRGLYATLTELLRDQVCVCQRASEGVRGWVDVESAVWF